MGREWLNEININWQKLNLADASNNVVPTNSEVERLLKKYVNVFKEGLGVINTFEAQLQVKEGAKPRFCKARPVSFALKEAIDRELDRLEAEGILERVTYSEWAAPVVPVPKTEGQIRLCGDYKVTINPVMEVDQYPLPKPDNIFATLATGKFFSKIDLTHAYQQMKLKEDSRDYVTINTHCGLFRYTRLPFGVASAPSIFQKVMDTVLQGLPKTICYLDDILVSRATKEKHLHNLEMVLQQLEQYNTRAKKAKCAFLCDAVEYLGHRIDADGLHTLSSKVKAIQDAPQPQNVQELRSFLGLLHYYGKFLPNLATLLHPLNALLKTGSNYSIEFRPTTAHANADGLSCLPLGTRYPASTDSVFTIGQIQALPVTVEQIATATRQDAVLSRVLHFVREGWPAEVSKELEPFARRRNELSTEANCLLWGICVIIPKKCQPQLCEELHSEHPGVSSMKVLARS